MKARLIEQLVILVLKLILPYLKKKVLETDTKVDDVIINLLSSLITPSKKVAKDGGP
jgi:hypothetical protein